MKSYQPKGSMCFTCKNNKFTCMNLPFHKMMVIKEFDDVFIVKCTEYERDT